MSVRVVYCVCGEHGVSLKGKCMRCGKDRRSQCALCLKKSCECVPVLVCRECKGEMENGERPVASGG